MNAPRIPSALRDRLLGLRAAISVLVYGDERDEVEPAAIVRVAASELGRDLFATLGSPRPSRPSPARPVDVVPTELGSALISPLDTRPPLPARRGQSRPLPLGGARPLTPTEVLRRRDAGEIPDDAVPLGPLPTEADVEGLRATMGRAKDAWAARGAASAAEASALAERSTLREHQRRRLSSISGEPLPAATIAAHLAAALAEEESRTRTTTPDGAA